MHCIVAHRWLGVPGRPVAIEGSKDGDRQMDVIASKPPICVIDL